MSYNKPLSRMSYLRGNMDNGEAPSHAALALAQSLVEEYDEHEKEQDLQNPQSVWYGITQKYKEQVCCRWQDFKLFREDVGRRPSFKHKLYRLDKAKLFEPGNVEWRQASKY